MPQNYDYPLGRVADRANEFIQKKTQPAKADLTPEGIRYLQDNDGRGYRWNVLYALKDMRPATVDMLKTHEYCQNMTRLKIVAVLNELESEGYVHKI